MSENAMQAQDFTRRDFLKGGSVAALMAMMGGVELYAEDKPAAGTTPSDVQKVKVAVIGLGPWGREILNTLAKVPEADVVAICDTYASSLRRAGEGAPGASKTNDYTTILANKDVSAVVVATPTHKHKEVVLAAIQAGKHVYCEAPMAHTLEDARAIAQAAKAAPQCLFQAGFQNRADPLRPFIVKNFVNAGAAGQFVSARAQFNKKQSWRALSSNPDRDKEINWRLDKSLSLGILGEIGCHQVDQANWFLHGLPVSVTGAGSLLFYKDDGRDVADTVHALLEYPGGVVMSYDATLGNSFESGLEAFYGTNAAILIRENRAWLFKEVDSPNFGWEVYAKKEAFGKDTGIMLLADATKSTDAPSVQKDPLTTAPLFFSLQNFLKNAYDVSAAKEEYVKAYGEDDKDGLSEHLTKKIHPRASAGYLEGYQATVVAIKANEAIQTNQRVEIKPDLYQLA